MSLSPEAMAVMAKANKRYGPGALVVASDIPSHEPMTSGSPSVDIALGGGWPAYQWSEIVGRESSSKTSLAYMTLVANQERDPNFTALWVAAEAYNARWARNIGVDNSRVHLAPTNRMEQAYDLLIDAAASQAYDLLVLDSYPALVAEQEDEKTMEDMVIGLGARRTGQFFRKVGSNMGRSVLSTERPVVGLFINQFRDKIGAFSPQGTPQTTPGGAAKNYAFYTRVELSRTEWIDEALAGKNMKRRVGQVVKAKVIKNKQAAPFKVAGYDFYFEAAPQHGFRAGEHDKIKELVTLGVLYDAIVRRGSYFDVAGETFKSKEGLYEGVRENLDIQEHLAATVHQLALGDVPPAVAEEVDDEEYADAA